MRSHYTKAGLLLACQLLGPSAGKWEVLPGSQQRALTPGPMSLQPQAAEEGWGEEEEASKSIVFFTSTFSPVPTRYRRGIVPNLITPRDLFLLHGV